MASWNNIVPSEDSDFEESVERIWFEAGTLLAWTVLVLMSVCEAEVVVDRTHVSKVEYLEPMLLDPSTVMLDS